MAFADPSDYVIKVFSSESNALSDTSRYKVSALSEGEVSGDPANSQYFDTFTKYWYRIEFNDVVAGFYIDWDDGEDNSPEKANSQVVMFDSPRTFGVVSHVYTKDGPFFPLVRVISTEGFWSKYYTASPPSGFTNDFKVLEEEDISAGGQDDYSIVTVNPLNSSSNRDIPFLYPSCKPPLAVLKSDRTKVFAGIDNDIRDTSWDKYLDTGAGKTVYVWHSEDDESAGSPINNAVPVDITYRNNDGKILTVSKTADTGGGSNEITDVARILKVKLTNVTRVVRHGQVGCGRTPLSSD